MARYASSMITDYVVFVIFTLGVLIYPIWLDKRTNKEKTKNNFIFARVTLLAMVFSIARGALGSRTLLGKKKILIF